MVHQSETGVPGSHQSRTWSEAGPPQSLDEAQAGQVYRRLSLLAIILDILLRRY